MCIYYAIKNKKLEELEYHTEWKIIETKNKQKILTDKLEIHIIQLGKLNKNIENTNESLVDWLIFLENPESERVIKKMEENKELKEAKDKLEKLSEDEKMKQLAWWREKAVYEENTRRNRECRKIKEAMAEGIVEGEKNKQLEIAKKLKEKGVDIKTIIETTGLTKEEVQNL